MLCKYLTASEFCALLDEQAFTVQREPSLEILLISLSILAGAVFAMAEMALVSANRSKLSQLAAKGSRRAQRALELIAQPTRFLSTVQTGITFAAVIGSIYAGAPLAVKIRPWLESLPYEWIRMHSHHASEAIVSFLIGSASILFGELIPKRLALLHPEYFALNLAWIMHAAATIAAPLIRSMSWAADFIQVVWANTDKR
jgi:putative hemolysin